MLFNCSVVSDCLWPTDCNTPGFPDFQHLLEFAQIHVHWISDAIQPSHPLLLLPSVFPSIQDSGKRTHEFFLDLSSCPSGTWPTLFHEREKSHSQLSLVNALNAKNRVWTSCPVGTYKSFKCLSVHLVPECENILKTQNVLFGYW